jgi:hypothetical protein
MEDGMYFFQGQDQRIYVCRGPLFGDHFNGVSNWEFPALSNF